VRAIDIGAKVQENGRGRRRPRDRDPRRVGRARSSGGDGGAHHVAK
jgi:hypothetical protein